LRQYEIWWADLPLPTGRRPVLLLSRDGAYAVRERVTVAEITTTIRSAPFEVPLGAAEGLPQRCVINMDSVAVVLKARLTSRIGALGRRKVAAVKRALGFALNWDELKAVDEEP
jgi:mRNA interferase MazF